jgi:hypothetical protein
MLILVDGLDECELEDRKSRCFVSFHFGETTSSSLLSVAQNTTFNDIQDSFEAPSIKNHVKKVEILADLRAYDVCLSRETNDVWKYLRGAKTVTPPSSNA